MKPADRGGALQGRAAFHQLKEGSLLPTKTTSRKYKADPGPGHPEGGLISDH